MKARVKTNPGEAKSGVTMSNVPLFGQHMQPVPRFDDCDVFLIIWTGGLRAAEAEKGQWRIAPVLHDAKPHLNGFYTRADLGFLMHQRGLRFVAFQQINWIGGACNSHWAPVIPGQSNFHQSPAVLWGSVARNLRSARAQPLLQKLQTASRQQIDAIMDQATQPERLARSIALSLRNLDTSVEQVASFYHEELINLLAAGQTDGSLHASMRDQALYARVHSFFLHLGAVRDYLAAFIAAQLGKDPLKTDSMARLIDTVRTPDISACALLQIFRSKGYIRPKPNTPDKWEATGWLESATDLRNEFVHRRTYGQLAAEGRGHLRPLDKDGGLFRYYRPIALGAAENDVFDEILANYQKVNELSYSCAQSSGHDFSIPHLTDKDIISVTIRDRRK